jgi:hypothetical protein
MDFGKFHFGRIEIDGVTYERDVVIDRGTIRKRKKNSARENTHAHRHTRDTLYRSPSRSPSEKHHRLS